MRRIALLLLAGASVLGLASIASAADLPRKAPPPPPPPCAQFGGFYVGANVGWGYGEHTFRNLDGLGAPDVPHEASRSVDGFAGGVQGGYNWQARCTLFGIEADYQWTDIDHDFVRTGPLGLVTLRVNSSLESFGTLRARTGVIVDNLLLYVTGGLAYANTERTVALFIPNNAFGPFSSDDTRWGWTMGFGTEWQFAPNWSFKSEVLYARFETEENTRICPGGIGGLCAAGQAFRFEHESSAWVTRIGLNYRFGGGFFGKAPGVAGY